MALRYSLAREPVRACPVWLANMSGALGLPCTRTLRGPADRRPGIAFVVAGIGSVIHWAGRVRGAAESPLLAPVARGAIAIGTIAGLAVAIPEVLGAANLG